MNRLVILLIALLVAGCGTVPTSGPIRSSNLGGSQSDQGQFVLEAAPPPRKAIPAQIVNGFFEAMGHPRNHEVARQYLTKEAAGSWRPERRMLVYDPQPESPELAATADGSLMLKAAWVATVDSRGSWRPERPNKLLTHTFAMDQVQGEWRITNPPDGVYITSTVFESNYDPVNLYFFNPAGDRLVPDPIYLPSQITLGQRATRLTQSLLAGPTDRLSNSVVNIVPQGTQVNVSVPVDAGSVATVALNDPPADLGPGLRHQLAAQITWTLSGISIREVRLTAKDAPLVDGGQEKHSRSDFDGYAPVPTSAATDLFVPAPPNGKGIWQVREIDQTQPQPDQTKIEGQLDKFRVASFAVELNGQRAAAVVPSERSVFVGQLRGEGEAGGPRRIDTDGQVLRPSYDGPGNLWIVDRADQRNPRIRMIDPEGKEQVVTATGLVGQRIRMLRVAPDGIRVLLVVGNDGNRQVMVGRLVSSGTPTKHTLEGFEELRLQLSDVVDAGWSKLDKITVLGTRSSIRAQNQPLEVNVDGSEQQPVAGRNEFNLTDLAVSPVSSTLLVVRDEKHLLHVQARDLSWNQLLTTERPVYPG